MFVTWTPLPWQQDPRAASGRRTNEIYRTLYICLCAHPISCVMYRDAAPACGDGSPPGCQQVSRRTAGLPQLKPPPSHATFSFFLTYMPQPPSTQRVNASEGINLAACKACMAMGENTIPAAVLSCRPAEGTDALCVELGAAGAACLINMHTPVPCAHICGQDM